MADSKKYDGSTWEHSLRKLTTATDTLTTLPADLYADGNNATVGLVGNMEQSGTPTPQNPITPSETGERTGNLFDVSKVTSNTGITNNGDGTLTVSGYPVNASENLGILCPDLKEGDIVTLKFNTTSTANLALIRYYDSGGLKWSVNWYSGTSKTITAEWLNARIGFYKEASAQGGGDATISNIMLNTGETPLPYEPYGYKIPISSASTTTPVYLGEVETTRKIRELVLTGEESWEKYTSTADSYLYYLTGLLRADASDCICTHTPYSSTVPNGSDAGVRISDSRAVLLLNCGSTTIQNNTKEDFKAWLAEQYAAGTPVTVWYVLVTPTTGIVNEPIRKIGDYADTVSGITIPTTTSKDTFDVQTTLKPSEVSLAYTGWHDATVKEWDGSQWQ